MNSLALRLDGEGPMYEQIRRALAREISNGALRPGDRLPNEMDMCDLLATSRMTVNRALSALVSDGLIVRRRKAGSFVADQSAIDAPLTISTAEQEIAASGGDYRFSILLDEQVPAPRVLIDRQIFGIADPTRHLIVCHFDGDEPAQLEERWINLNAVPQSADVNFDDESPGMWLLGNVAWTQAEHEIAAVAADDEAAEHLQIGSGTACLQLERRTWIDEITVTFVRLTYPGHMKRLVGRFKPGE